MNVPDPHVVIFDVEGTLIDCAPQTIECWRRTLADHGHQFTIAELHRYLGMDAELMLSSLLGEEYPELKDTLLKEQGKRYRSEFLPTAQPFPGVRELFAALTAQGHRLGLATTSLPDELRIYLRLLGVTEFVSATVCGDDVKREKPAPDIVTLAAKRLLATDRERLWVVGDTPYDAQSATRAGAKAIGVLGGGFTAEALKRSGCIAVASDLFDLRKTLDGLLAERMSAAAGLT